MGKKFIDKSKALTYRLVPKETGADQFDENQPKHTFVLVPNKRNKGRNVDEFLFQDDDSKKPETSNERVFPSKGPRPDWDPDVVACLDDDFDFEDPDNILEDDFMAKANAGAPYAKDVLYDFKRKKCGLEEIEDNDDESLGSDFGFCEYSDDEFGSNDEHFNFKKSPKSKLSQYSMTSAITNCTEDVQILNDKFDKLLDEYEDDQIGALDGEDIQLNGVTVEKHAVCEILNGRDPRDEEYFIPEKCEEDLKNTILQKAVDEQLEKLVSVVVEKKSVDCISVVGSCCSTAYQPAVIPVERSRTTSSSTVQSSVKDQPEEKSDANELRKLAAIISCRQKGETTEQRKERKQMVKATRKESRLLKKEVKLAFKNERKKQSMEKANAYTKLGFTI